MFSFLMHHLCYWILLLCFLKLYDSLFYSINGGTISGTGVGYIPNFCTDICSDHGQGWLSCLNRHLALLLIIL